MTLRKSGKGENVAPSAKRSAQVFSKTLHGMVAAKIWQRRHLAIMSSSRMRQRDDTAPARWAIPLKSEALYPIVPAHCARCCLIQSGSKAETPLPNQVRSGEVCQEASSIATFPLATKKDCTPAAESGSPPRRNRTRAPALHYDPRAPRYPIIRSRHHSSTTVEERRARRPDVACSDPYLLDNKSSYRRRPPKIAAAL